MMEKKHILNGSVVDVIRYLINEHGAVCAVGRDEHNMVLEFENKEVIKIFTNTPGYIGKSSGFTDRVNVSTTNDVLEIMSHFTNLISQGLDEALSKLNPVNKIVEYLEYYNDGVDAELIRWRGLYYDEVVILIHEPDDEYQVIKMGYDLVPKTHTQDIYPANSVVEEELRHYKPNEYTILARKLVDLNKHYGIVT